MGKSENTRAFCLSKKRFSCKPNIVPILDAVFIFIFFLLMSAEFIKFYIINSDAPAIKMVDSLGNNQDRPLNLALEILPNRIIIKTNPEGQVRNVLSMKNGDYDWDKLLEIIITLKKKNIEENSIILRPHDKIAYKTVIRFIDVVRELPNKLSPLVAKNKKGNQVEAKVLFDRVIFEKDRA